MPHQLRAGPEGPQPVIPVAVLNLPSGQKAGKIIRCTDFNHDACGEDAAADARAAGYYGAWGENLYIAEGRYGSPRVALDGLAQLPRAPREPLHALLAAPRELPWRRSPDSETTKT